MGRVADGTEVFIHRSVNVGGRHVENLVREALGSIRPTEEHFQTHTVDFRHPIGFDNVVEIRPGDTVLYAQIKRSGNWVSFIDGIEEGRATSALTISLKRRGESFQIVKAHLGDETMPSPDDRSIKTDDQWNDAVDYWEQNALLGKWLRHHRLIDEGTITRESPWYEDE
ncbi:MAG: hypothetical protein KDD62_04165 [Bdellovibrionales bacterium]|nr:hypothetical protein [Bdellovibrionales bacterium]